MNYIWNIEQTPGGEKIQVTISIYDDPDTITGNYIGEFTMFLNDEDEVLDFLEQGLVEYREYHSIMNHFRPLESKAIKEAEV